MKNRATSYQRLTLGSLDNLEVLAAEQYNTPFPAHSHDTFCISLIEAGTFNENELFATQGSICVTNPGEVHVNRVVHEPGCSFKTFYVSPDLLKALNQNQAVQFSSKVIEDVALYQQLRQVATNLEPANFGQPAARVLTEQLQQLIRQHADPTPAADPTANDEVLRQIQHYIQQALSEKISLQTLARLAGMDKFKFIRFFKKHCGLSPFAYVTLQRIERSKQALRQKMPLVDVALEAGFYDQSHHCTYFRHYVGVTPAEYRAGCNILQY